MRRPCWAAESGGRYACPREFQIGLVRWTYTKRHPQKAWWRTQGCIFPLVPEWYNRFRSKVTWWMPMSPGHVKMDRPKLKNPGRGGVLEVSQLNPPSWISKNRKWNCRSAMKSGSLYLISPIILTQEHTLKKQDFISEIGHVVNDNRDLNQPKSRHDWIW